MVRRRIGCTRQVVLTNPDTISPALGANNCSNTHTHTSGAQSQSEPVRAEVQDVAPAGFSAARFPSPPCHPRARQTPKRCHCAMYERSRCGRSAAPLLSWDIPQSSAAKVGFPQAKATANVYLIEKYLWINNTEAHFNLNLVLKRFIQDFGK